MRRCEDHFLREEAHLRRLIDSLRRVRAACQTARLDTLEALLHAQNQHLEEDGALIHERERLRQDLALFLDLPLQRLTLSDLLQSLPPPARNRLEPHATRLRSLLADAEQLRRHNAAMIGYSLSFLRGLFQSMSGWSVGERYTPQGKSEHGAVVGLLTASRG